jgi:Carboxypeptidase regulatory-like domain
MRRCDVRSLVRLLICFATVVLLASADTAGKVKLSGRVTDSHGVMISGANLIVHWDPSGSDTGLGSNVGLREDLSVRVDKSGVYSVEVPPGFYDVFVSSPAFEPFCRKVRLRPGESQTLNPKLAVSLLVTKELADKPF